MNVAVVFESEVPETVRAPRTGIGRVCGQEPGTMKFWRRAFAAKMPLLLVRKGAEEGTLPCE